ncbi:MAG: hypothetical protein GY950_22050, partial [bacterium]|nr:hypothetical protein [bacterium]
KKKKYKTEFKGDLFEPGEVESQLLAYEGIKEAAVTIVNAGTGDRQFCAYIVPHFFDSLHVINHADLRGFLSQRLPRDMIPGYFVIMEALPITPGGEISRAMLPYPEKPVREAYTPPRNKIEKTLVNIWAELLNMDEEDIGIDDDFFDQGGHSLNAMRLLTRINNEFDVQPDMNEVMDTSTIRQLAKLIEEKLK